MKRNWPEIILLTFFAAALIGPGVQYGKIYLFHLMLLPMIWVLARQIFRHGMRPIVLPVWIIGAFLLWSTLSLSWSISFRESCKFLVILGMGAFVIFTLSQVLRDEHLPKIGKIFVALWLVQLAIGLLEIFTSFRYPISKISAVNHLFGIDYYEQEYPLDAWNVRDFPTGLSWSMNSYATYLVLCLSFLPTLRISRSLKLILAGATLLVLTCEGSRTCMFAALLSLFVWGIYFLHQGRLNTLAVRVAALSILLLVISLLSAHTEILKESRSSAKAVLHTIRTGEIRSKKELSVSKRLVWYQDAMQSIFRHPWLGIGVGQSGSQQIHPSSGKNISLHFFFLESLVDSGLIGFLMLWFAYLSMIWQLAKNGDRLAIGTAVALVCFIPASMSLSSGVYFLPWYLTLGLGAALLTINKAGTKSKPYRLPAIGNSP